MPAIQVGTCREAEVGHSGPAREQDVVLAVVLAAVLAGARDSVLRARPFDFDHFDAQRTRRRRATGTEVHRACRDEDIDLRLEANVGCDGVVGEARSAAGAVDSRGARNALPNCDAPTQRASHP